MKYALTILALVFIIGCGGGGGGSTDCTFADPVTPSYDLDGQFWTMGGTTPENNCPDPNYTFSVSGTFSQSGNTLTVTGEGVTLTGQISDGQIKWGGTIEDGDQVLTIECTTMDVNGVEIGDTMSFTNTNWTVDYGTGTCSGTATGTFIRVS